MQIPGPMALKTIFVLASIFAQIGCGLAAKGCVCCRDPPAQMHAALLLCGLLKLMYFWNVSQDASCTSHSTFLHFQFPFLNRYVWETFDSTNAPARYGHATALMGDTMYMFGGVENGATVDGLHKYDVATNSWYSFAPIAQHNSSSSALTFSSHSPPLVVAVSTGTNHPIRSGDKGAGIACVQLELLLCRAPSICNVVLRSAVTAPVSGTPASARENARMIAHNDSLVIVGGNSG